MCRLCSNTNIIIGWIVEWIYLSNETQKNFYSKWFSLSLSILFLSSSTSSIAAAVFFFLNNKEDTLAPIPQHTKKKNIQPTNQITHTHRDNTHTPTIKHTIVLFWLIILLSHLTTKTNRSTDRSPLPSSFYQWSRQQQTLIYFIKLNCVALSLSSRFHHEDLWMIICFFSFVSSSFDKFLSLFFLIVIQ